MAPLASRTADAALVSALIDWFDANERPLPWRSTSPWGVLVSEFMLQQTPVDRVLPVWHEWMHRWGTAPDLAGASAADAIRAWGRLGYPRRAVRLHQSAVTITEQHGGEVPDDADALRALPGVGDYTAAAVLAFAFDRRSIVLDTNVRRVVARVAQGIAAAPGHVTRAEREAAEALWPVGHRRSARWSAAVMEFGALVCTARRPACDRCPISARCGWLSAGRPTDDNERRTQAPYAGSDRQARGRIMALLRDTDGPLSRRTLLRAMPDDVQGARALDALIGDGLVEPLPGGRVGLPA